MYKKGQYNPQNMIFYYYLIDNACLISCYKAFEQ